MIYKFYNELISDKNIIKLQTSRETHLKVLMFNQIVNIIKNKYYENQDESIHDYFTCVRLGIEIDSQELYFSIIQLIIKMKSMFKDCHTETFYKYYEHLLSDIDALIENTEDEKSTYNLKEYKLKLITNFRQQQINVRNKKGKED